ncbi:MAG: hypothetical protein K5945_02435 [Bacteroidaceae bacterium]|nr:hypothetical protein [Bacteroidaceae bacterium]
MKKRRYTITLNDYIRANRKASRDAEQELLGPGFHAHNRVHDSKKTYSRKRKHKGDEL